MNPSTDPDMKFSHAYTLTFEVFSNLANADDVNPHEVRAAILHRMFTLTDQDLMDVIERFDTIEN
jgi:hypothetical protein